MDKEKTGLLIKNARLQKGYTQTELGDILGVSNKAISRWENGDSFPDVGILEELSNCLDISIEKLVSGESSEDKEKALSELLRIVKIQAKDSIRRKYDIISNLIILFIMTIRFYFAFISGKGYSWDFKYDFLLLVLCSLILIWSITRKLNMPEDERDSHYRIYLIISLILLMISMVIMIGAIYYCDSILALIEPKDFGPVLSKLLGVIALMNIGLFEYYWFKMRAIYSTSTIVAIVSIANLFLCISYREWMGSALSLDYALHSIGIITVSILLTMIAIIVVMKYIHKCKKLE